MYRNIQWRTTEYGLVDKTWTCSGESGEPVWCVWASQTKSFLFFKWYPVASSIIQKMELKEEASGRQKNIKFLLSHPSMSSMRGISAVPSVVKICTFNGLRLRHYCMVKIINDLIIKWKLFTLRDADYLWIDYLNVQEVQDSLISNYSAPLALCWHRLQCHGGHENMAKSETAIAM